MNSGLIPPPTYPPPCVGARCWAVMKTHFKHSYSQDQHQIAEFPQQLFFFAIFCQNVIWYFLRVSCNKMLKVHLDWEIESRRKFEFFSTLLQTFQLCFHTEVCFWWNTKFSDIDVVSTNAFMKGNKLWKIKLDCHSERIHRVEYTASDLSILSFHTEVYFL